MSPTTATTLPLTISRIARSTPPCSMRSRLSLRRAIAAENFSKTLLKHFALQEPGNLARKAGGLSNEQAFQRRCAIDQAQADITHGAQQRRFIGEQEVERVGRKAHRHGVEPPPALIALEHIRLAGIDTKPGGVNNDLRKRGHILQAHIEPLARDRMNDVGGIADQRQTVTDKGTRDEIAERKSARFVERLHFTEMQAKPLLELAVKLLFVERRDPRGLGAFFGPDQRRAFTGQGQDRERTRGKEMLFGAAMVVALMADRDYDSGLIVFPAMGGDSGTLAQFRARAVGGHQKACFDDIAIRKRHGDAVAARGKIGNRETAKVDPLGGRTLNQRVDQIAVLDHVRERFTRLDISRKRQEYRPRGVLQFGIRDNHIQDRLRTVRDLVPNTDRLEKPATGGNDGGGAWIAAGSGIQRRINDDNGKLESKALTERQRQRQPS